MPISVQKIIISARPIFTVILARLFLKEAFGKLDVRDMINYILPSEFQFNNVQVLTIALLAPGLILVIQPSFIFTNVSSQEQMIIKSVH